MGLDLEAVEKTFRGLIRTLLIMPANSVRRANQFNPPPAGNQKEEFATVLIQEIGPLGWDEVTYLDTTESGYGQTGFGQGGFGQGEAGGFGEGGFGDDGFGEDVTNDIVELITGQRHFVASVQFFRGKAMLQAMRLGALLQSSNAREALIAAGIGLGKIGSPKEVSKVIDTFYETRSQMDIEFYLINQEEVAMQTFGKFSSAIYFEP